MYRDNNYQERDLSTGLPAEFSQPSTLAGNAIAEAANNDTNPEHFQNLKCSICLCNPSVNTRLDSTVCGHIFCHACLSQALKVSKRCPTCRHSLSSRYAVHPLYPS